MAIKCAHCGKMLPRDDARFCTNCGTSVSTPPSHSQPSSNEPEESLSPIANVSHRERGKPALREQIAYMPPRRPKPRTTQDEPSISTGNDRSNQALSIASKAEEPKKVSEVAVQDSQQKPVQEVDDQKLPSLAVSETAQSLQVVAEIKEELPEKAVELENTDQQQKPLLTEDRQEKAVKEDEEAQPEKTKIAVERGQQQKSVTKANRPQKVSATIKEEQSVQKEKALGAPKQNDSTSTSASVPGETARSLGVRVWEEQETVSLEASEETSLTEEDIVEKDTLEENIVEHLPTRPLAAPPDSPRPHPVVPDSANKEQDRRREEIEHLDTMQISAQVPAKPVKPISPPSTSVPTPVEVGMGVHARVTPIPPMPAQPRAAVPSSSSVQAKPLASQAQAIPTPVRPVTRRHVPLVAIILLPVLLLGGLGMFIVLSQSLFTVSPVTQPWQSFKDSSLGFSSPYPSSWSYRMDRAKSTVYFYDSSHTAQVNVAVTNVASGDLTTYLSQQAKRLGLTSTQSGSPVSFAHASWQQIQGNLQQSGANYTATILATVHNNRLFTVTQMAPQSNYADQDSVIFSHMREGWQFV